MFILSAEKNKLTMLRREPVTSGSVGACRVRVQFSEDWEGMAKTAVFRAGERVRAAPLDDSGECTVPWEVLTEPGHCLMAGVCGRRGEDLVLPTVWAGLGRILEGVTAGAAPQPPEQSTGAGAADHRLLSHRDAEGQHPIGAITGLGDALADLRVPPAAAEEEVEEMLDGVFPREAG